MVETPAQPAFEDVSVGDELPVRETNPLTIEDTVRWAGFQESVAHVHYDREWVREHAGLKSFVASGAWRQALFAAVITDWIGPRGWLREMAIRQVASTFEGDSIRFSGRITEKSDTPEDPWLHCELVAHNQHGEVVMSGRCTVLLPSATSPIPRASLIGA